MALSNEIKKQISSIKKIQKITDAMQKVAVTKMRRTQQNMRASTAYATKIREVVGHVASCNTDYHSPYLQVREQIKRVDYIVISTDRGLCGGLNLNLFRKVVEHANQFQKQGIEVTWCLFGEKARDFFSALSVKVVAYIASLGEYPKISDLIGSLKVMLDAYKLAQSDRLFIAHNEFVSAMVQKPVITQLLPLIKIDTISNRNWDYIYEPEPKSLLDTLIIYYVESQMYQSVVDNIACEQVARMMAMKSATDNAKTLIENLKLMYNKARQAIITQEISEIIAGAEST